MLRRSLSGLIAPLAVALLLAACGNPSSEEANRTSSEDGYDQTAATETDTDRSSGEDVGYEEQESSSAQNEPGGDYDEPRYQGSDRRSGYASTQRRPSQVASRPAPSYAPPQRRPVARQVATPAVGAGVRGDVRMFYDALDRDGTWVQHPDYEYVWLPARMGQGWRPYQEGRWLWTEDYGWYWESEEPFAWAVYHYGRWDYDPDYGWFWVPGDTWAPAWVTWRTGGDEIGWAPIAPDRRGFAAGTPRRYQPPVAESWVFVQAPHFAEPDLSPYVRPMDRIMVSLEAAREVRTPRWERDRMVNFGAPPSELRRYLRQPVPSRELVYVGNRDDMFEDVDGRRMGIYRPTIVSVETREPPRRIGDLRDAARVVLLDFTEQTSERLYDAPSAALLDVLDRQERQRLVEARLQAKQAAALDAEIEQLQRARTELIEKRRRQAERLEAKLEREREEAKAERKRLREMIRAEKRGRAEKITIEAAATPPAPEAAPASQPGQAPVPAPAPSESAIAPAPAEPAVAAPAPAPVDVGARGDDDEGRRKRRRDRDDDQAREPLPPENAVSPAPAEPPAAAVEPKPPANEPTAPAEQAPAKGEASPPLIQVSPAPAAGEAPPPLIKVNPAPAADAPLLGVAPKPEAVPPAEQAPMAAPEEAKAAPDQGEKPRRRMRDEDAAGAPAATGEEESGKRRKARAAPPEQGEPQAPVENAVPPAAPPPPPPPEQREGRRGDAPPDPITGVLEGTQGALNSLGLGERPAAPQAQPAAASEPPRKAKKRAPEEPPAAESAGQEPPAEALPPPVGDPGAEVPVEAPPE
jgi:hypothetical protein